MLGKRAAVALPLGPLSPLGKQQLGHWECCRECLITHSHQVFMFFLIKGLLWLALGGGLFVSIRQLWRRVRRQPASGEQDPLLDPEAAEERQQENSD